MANGFGDRIAGLLGDPGFNMGLGLLAAGGPSRQPMSLGQGLARASQFTSERERASMQNDAMRQQIMARQKQQQAMGQLPGLLSGGNAEMEQTLGLLGDVSPEMLAQTAFGQMFPQEERAPPKEVRLAQFMTDPNVPQEQKDLVRQQIESSDNGEMLANQIRLLQAQQLERQLATEQDEKERDRIGARISVLNADEALREAAQINQRLRGTMGETGLGFNDLRESLAGPWASFVNLFGGDSSQARQVASDMQRFEQLTTREGLQALFTGQVDAGTLTNTKMNTYLTTKPSLERLPETNNKIIADMLQDNLDSAQVLGIEIPDRSATTQLIDSLRGEGAEPVPMIQASNTQARSGPRVADIRRMSIQQLGSLDIDSMTDEQARAALERLDQLER